MTVREFLDRFVHPRVAAIAIGGALLWGVSFLIAAIGVIVRTLEEPFLAATLFVGSSLVGLLGMIVLAGCGGWLLAVRLRQVLLD